VHRGGDAVRCHSRVVAQNEDAARSAVRSQPHARQQGLMNSARHVIRRSFNPRVLSQTVSYDVASTIHQSLPVTTMTAPPPAGTCKGDADSASGVRRRSMVAPPPARVWPIVPLSAQLQRLHNILQVELNKGTSVGRDEDAASVYRYSGALCA
jgi:hypothetical protein